MFVTGTDTGVGKTLVSTMLAAGWAARGVRVGVMKPCETGCVPGGPEDAHALRRAAGDTGPLEETCVYALSRPLSPEEAGRVDGVEVDPARIVAAFARVRARSERVLVEGAGGLLVPVAPGLDIAGLAARLSLPLVVVARAGLGTVNHTRLTVEAARARGLAVRAVVLVRARSETDESEASNPAAIARWCGVEVLGPIPFLSPYPSPEQLAPLAERYLSPLL